MIMLLQNFAFTQSKQLEPSREVTESKFVWMTDLAEARTLASSLNKPLLIVFRCEP
jgi:hypothetical protein